VVDKIKIQVSEAKGRNPETYVVIPKTITEKLELRKSQVMHVASPDTKTIVYSKEAKRTVN